MENAVSHCGSAVPSLSPLNFIHSLLTGGKKENLDTVQTLLHSNQNTGVLLTLLVMNLKTQNHARYLKEN